MSKILEDIREQVTESEMTLVRLAYYDVRNYRELKVKIDTDEFIDLGMKIMFDSASILYRKYEFKRLDSERIKLIISDKDIDEDFKELLKLNVDLFQMDLGLSLDLKGEYQIYTKNLGMYKFIRFIEVENGGLNEMFNKLNNIEHNSEDVRNYLLAHIQSSFDNYKSKPKESDLEVGLDDLVEEIVNDKMEIGIPQRFSKYTNHFTGGIFKGVHYLGASSGRGKTTWLMVLYLLPILLAKDMNGDYNEKVLIIANEQGKKTFQKLILIAIYCNIYRFSPQNDSLKDRFIRRHRIERGKASSLDKRLIKDVAEFYKERFMKRIKFVFMPMFSPDDIQTCIENNAMYGYTNILLDTMKAEQKGEYQLLANLATKLDMIAKELELRIVATVQLAIYSMNRKYLDHTCLAESKQIVEIAEHSLYFRYTDLTELGGLQVYRFVNEYDEDGNFTGAFKELIEIGEMQGLQTTGEKDDKDLWQGMKYLLLFVGKNRHGESDKIVLARVNFDIMYYEEVGIVEGLKYDSKV